MANPKKLILSSLFLVIGSAFISALADDKTEKKPKTTKTKKKKLRPIADVITGSSFSALRVRSLGPALNSGRVTDIAARPDRPGEYYVATASGGLWKTTNNGTTFRPIFDRYGSYSIGCVTTAPSNHNVVWVGTGENNSQRSVSFGDGVYKSIDGGKTFRNMGLKNSEHIGMISIHPKNENLVYVAAQGPLWRSGGDRGLYMTRDGGKTWTLILKTDKDTGVNEVHMDPRNPRVLYATTYQRRRRVWTMVNGGPNSHIMKSTDGGRSWRTIEKGIPGGDKGKIGLDISPANPDRVYAIVEATKGLSGIFKSQDRGESWTRVNTFESSAPMYYNEIVCDPKNADKLYVLDTYLHVSTDGGRTLKNVQGRRRHVDNHALYIHPRNTQQLIVGCDGGVYDSWDGGATWQYKANLPITQFYRVCVDNRKPFYYLYGGTQDNNTLGGPSRTTRRSISNEDWFVTVGGDGFETQVDPTDPNIVYSQWQYGGLVRHDLRNGENVDIKPRPEPGEKPYVFNWDAPLLISPHNHKRLYFGGRRLYRSDDRGNSWRPISGDLSRGIDRNKLKVMGKIQPVNAVGKHRSTSIYGNTVALSESPLVENLLYVGTDDGLVHVSDDGGKTWRKVDVFPEVPYKTYVSCLTASRHDKDTVYAAFDNHKNGDFKPYLLKSVDRGRNWTKISGDLGSRDIVYSIMEDHVRKDLLFCGTEFGAHFTLNGGKKWLKVPGLPVIAVRDIDIQRRENDLVLATFGRGFYILDDYSPLQTVTSKDLDKSAHIFPIKDALFYIPSSKGRGSQGSSYWTAKNPPFGAVFTYHIKKTVKSDPKIDNSTGMPDYKKLREKERVRAATVTLVIKDSTGKVIRQLKGQTNKGIHRMSWDLRHGGWGPYVLPGKYSVEIVQQLKGKLSILAGPTNFEVKHLALGTFQPEDRKEIEAFYQRVLRLNQAVSAAGRVLAEAASQLSGVESAVFNTPGADPKLAQDAHDYNVRLKELEKRLNGDKLPARFGEPTLPGIRERVRLATASWRMTAPPTKTQRKAYDFAASEFELFLKDLRALIEKDIRALQGRLDKAGVRWTGGRLPNWKK